MVKVLTVLLQKIWDAKEWQMERTESLITPLPKKGNLRLLQNYTTISLISHSRKEILRIILNRLKPMVDDILAEEHAGFRDGKSTTEQIFNIKLLVEKQLDDQRELYHNFIDSKKAFDWIWHDGL